MDSIEELRREILEKVETYFHLAFKTEEFIPGETKVNYGGRVFDQEELVRLVDSSLDFWLTTGRYAEKFEKAFAKYLGVKYCSLTNSGSSANLLAFMSLTSPLLGEKRVKRGDEVITVAAGFPTTVTPVIQYGAVPVFVDVTPDTYNIDVTQLEAALSDKTRAVMLAHTLGNPFDISAVKGFCDENNLWFIEDNCDALGSKYQGKYTGTFGDIGTSSFYPPHHITMGEGGAVYTNNPMLKKILLSMRDWGRDCWCDSGVDNTCGKRFSKQFGLLPFGYDHKYVYSTFGYNLKITDMQAAVGCAQLEKLTGFIEQRKKNYTYLLHGLKRFEYKMLLPYPTENSDPSWFGFPITVNENAGFTRDDIVKHLESSNIQTRMLFAGNLLKHPCFDEMRAQGNGYRVVGELKNTDRIMNNTFWVGVYPGMSEEKLAYIVDKIACFALSYAN
ncbi:MAG: lipopolysaccharide biosynthesis protein RfbH [Lentimicrobiaceae bacterium]|jgi:CDP-4-dehydro-6-deoxyglucose reductase, E1|nr:lipopolysaccharide biosynthesis protein RfbH [Candidatus Scalindua sp.]MBT6671617.1 lipopolysaccharide biosynthesis protein RfbH [Lentimicrobiaceae bacterium]